MAAENLYKITLTYKYNTRFKNKKLKFDLIGQSKFKFGPTRRSEKCTVYALSIHDTNNYNIFDLVIIHI